MDQIIIRIKIPRSTFIWYVHASQISNGRLLNTNTKFKYAEPGQNPVKSLNHCDRQVAESCKSIEQTGGTIIVGSNEIAAMNETNLEKGIALTQYHATNTFCPTSCMIGHVSVLPMDQTQRFPTCRIAKRMRAL